MTSKMKLIIRKNGKKSPRIAMYQNRAGDTRDTCADNIVKRANTSVAARRMVPEKPDLRFSKAKGLIDK